MKNAYGPPLKYPGSKWRLAGRINSLLPASPVYLEPFGGSASVLLQRDLSPIEILNDLDGDVTAFWRCMRTDPERLARLVSWTPYSRAEYEASASQPPGDDWERARLFAVRTWQGFGSKISGCRGWRRGVMTTGGMRSAPDDWAMLPARLRVVGERIRRVHIECRPAMQLLNEFRTKDCAIYADPPYHPGTIADPRFYKCRMSERDHADLLAALASHPGPVVLSGYAHEDYDRALPGWHRQEHASVADGGRHRIEVLWVNPVALSALKETHSEAGL